MAVEAAFERRAVPTEDFWKGKRVLVTGHTGFKGSWMCEVLLGLGAKVSGYALDPEPNSLFDLADLGCRTNTFIGDVRDPVALMEAFNIARPEVVIHMAAQPLVRAGYERPSYTYDVNVMGTVNVLECCRRRLPKSVVNVTTDKVYRNDDIDGYRYVEGDALDGFDPYSNSKSCSELVTATYASGPTWCGRPWTAPPASFAPPPLRAPTSMCWSRSAPTWPWPRPRRGTSRWRPHTTSGLTRSPT